MTDGTAVKAEPVRLVCDLGTMERAVMEMQ